MPPGSASTFETRRDVDAVAEDVASSTITSPRLMPMRNWIQRAGDTSALRRAIRSWTSTAHDTASVDALELHQHAVAGGLDDAAPVLGDGGSISSSRWVRAGRACRPRRPPSAGCSRPCRRRGSPRADVLQRGVPRDQSPPPRTRPVRSFSARLLSATNTPRLPRPGDLKGANARRGGSAAFAQLASPCLVFALGAVAEDGAKARLLGLRLLEMPAELEAHRRQQLVLVLGVAARDEALIERGAQHRHRHALVDSRLDRPATFAGIGHATGEFRERQILSSAVAVRSRSHEAMTLPRRQTSATSGRLRSYW